MAQQSTAHQASVTVPGSKNGGADRRELYLKLFSGDYNVEITSKGISKFSHTSINLQYFIATESDSSFGG